MICEPSSGNRKQYAENTVFEEDTAEICSKGMHFCKDPLAVLDYYPLVDENGNMSEFTEVEALDKCKTNDNQKFCTKKLKIGAKISFSTLVQASVSFEMEKDGKIKDKAAEKITSKGYGARIGSSGNVAKIGSSGDYAKIGSSGYCAKIGSSGYCAQIGSSGNDAQIISSGENSVICCAGSNSIVKAKIGSWVTLSEWSFDKEKNMLIPVCVKTEYVDGERIKADVFYKLIDGKFTEAK